MPAAFYGGLLGLPVAWSAAAAADEVDLAVDGVDAVHARAERVQVSPGHRARRERRRRDDPSMGRALLLRARPLGDGLCFVDAKTVFTGR